LAVAILYQATEINSAIVVVLHTDSTIHLLKFKVDENA